MPELKSEGSTPKPTIVSNSSDKILQDLERDLQPSESRPGVLPWIRTVSPETMRLLADSEFADDLAIAICVTFLQVVKQASALAYQHQKPAT